MKKRIALSVVTALGAGLLVAAPASAAQTVALSQSALRAGVAGSVKVTLGTAATAGEVATGAQVAIRINSVPSASAGAVVNDVYSTAVAASDTSKSVVTPALKFNVAGVYAVTYWYDVNGNNAIDAGEAYGAGSIAIGGVPATVTLTGGPTTVVVGTAADAFTSAAKDAAGIATALTTGEFLNVVSSTSGSGTGVYTGTQPALGAYSVSPAAAAEAGVYTLTVSPGGSLPGTIPVVTSSLTVLAAAAQAPTDFASVTTANVTAGGVAGTRTLAANSTATSLDLTATGATAGSPVVLALSSTAAPSSIKLNGNTVTAGASYYVGTADANGAVNFNVTATDATSMNGKDLTLTGAAGKTLAISWANATISASTTNKAIVVAPGSAVSLTIKVKDQYGNLKSGYLVTAQTKVTTAGTGGPAVNTLGAIVSGATGADGTLTLSVPAVAGTVNGTVASVLYTVTDATGFTTIAGPGAPAFVASYVTDAAVTSVTLTNASGSYATQALADASGGVTVPFDGVPSVGAGADAAQITVASNPNTYITVSAPAGVMLLDGGVGGATAPTTWNGGAMTVTVASGNDVYVWSTKPGTYAIKATAGGQTDTRYVKVVAGGTGSARNIAVAVDKATLEPGAFGVATVSVTDAFGNAVSTTGTPLSITASGQILLQGSAVTLTGDAGTDGTFKVSYIGAGTAGTGSLTVTAKPLATNQFKAVAGYAQGSATVDNTGAAGVGTKGADLSASTASVTQGIAVKASATVDTTTVLGQTAAAVTQLQTDLAKQAADAAAAAKATAAAIATQQAAVATLQTSVASLTTTVAALVASMTAQIKVINATLLSISKAQAKTAALIAKIRAKVKA